MSLILDYLTVGLVQCLVSCILVYSFASILVNYYRKRTQFAAIAHIPGPPSRYPLIGNLDIFWDSKKGLNHTIKERLTALAILYDKERIFKLYIGQQPVVYLFKPETVQSVLANNAVIDKSHEYEMVEPWLGKGLGTRNGDSWRVRRKILGPAFHFHVLKDFIPIINEQSRIFCDVLASKDDHQDISQLSINCALDIICETAMGLKLNTQMEPNNEYAHALHRFTEIFVVRILSPWLWPAVIFWLTRLGREMSAQIDILHRFTRSVIRNRKADFIDEMVGKKKFEYEEVDDNGQVVKTVDSLPSAAPEEMAGQLKASKKRLAFLDLLIKLHLEGALSEEEVREEVDMFTFAGHDTTGISVAFTMFLIGSHPDVQDRLHEEMDNIFGGDRTRLVTTEDLRQMTYLECVIKESLRLYPSGPFFARQLAEDVTTNGYLMPKGTVVWLCILSLHMNEEVFAEPARFDPDRFSVAQARGRHPYAYLPFSGGPRGCLGQKFAMMEEKIILANVMRRFRLRSLSTADKLVLTSEIILRPKSPIAVACTPRFMSDKCDKADHATPLVTEDVMGSTEDR